MYEARTVMRGDNLFESEIKGQKVLMDTGSPERAGQSPLELLLSAISGCASVDVVEIIRKKRMTVNGLEVQVQADRREEPYPRIFTRIALHFVLNSPDATDKALEQAVKLSMDKYCSVAGMLRDAATIDYSWEIKPN